MPISCVRWVTSDESTPKSPIEASTSASPAKTAMTNDWKRRWLRSSSSTRSIVRTSKTGRFLSTAQIWLFTLAISDSGSAFPRTARVSCV